MGSRRNGSGIGNGWQLGKRRAQRVHQLVAHAVEADDTGDALDAALAPAPGDVNHNVDRLRDQRTGWIHRHFENQLLQAQQRAERGAGMDRGDTARMTGAPHLDEIQRLGAAHLADDDTIRPQAH